MLKEWDVRGIAKREYESVVRDVRRRGRPRKCWIGGVKVVLARKGLNIQEAKVSVQDRNEWRSICRRVWHAVGESPAGCMERPGGWLWKLRFCWDSYPRTTVKNESGTHEFPCSSVEATPYWGKGQQIKKYTYIVHTHTHTHIHTYICIYIIYIDLSN